MLTELEAYMLNSWGKHIDTKLNFSFHISEICQMARSQLNIPLKQVAHMLEEKTYLQLSNILLYLILLLSCCMVQMYWN